MSGTARTVSGRPRFVVLVFIWRRTFRACTTYACCRCRWQLQPHPAPRCRVGPCAHGCGCIAAPCCRPARSLASSLALSCCARTPGETDSKEYDDRCKGYGRAPSHIGAPGACPWMPSPPGGPSQLPGCADRAAHGAACPCSAAGVRAVGGSRCLRRMLSCRGPGPATSAHGYVGVAVPSGHTTWETYAGATLRYAWLSYPDSNFAGGWFAFCCLPPLTTWWRCG